MEVPDIRSLLNLARAWQDAAQEEAEANKIGKLRGGSSGCIGADNEIYGLCHRKTMLRFMGHDLPAEESQKILFDMGNANEDCWYNLLKTSWPGPILREEEFPLAHNLDGSETIISGRPDMVLCEGTEDNPMPVLGMEHKCIFSKGAAIDAELLGKPKTEHLIQSAVYSSLFNLPWVLCYTNPSWWKMEFDRKKFGINNIKPFWRMYYLRWNDDELLEYRDEFSSEWITTACSKSGILDYYRLVVEMQATQLLGPRPSDKGIYGEPLKWAPCRFCEYSDNCDRNEHDFSTWVTEAKKIIDEQRRQDVDLSQSKQTI